MKRSLDLIFFSFCGFMAYSCTHDSHDSSIQISNETNETFQGAAYYEQRLFKPGDFGSAAWRIPVITQLEDGTLLIANDKRKIDGSDLPNDIDVVCRISNDNGRTWSELITIEEGKGVDHGCGDPAIVQAANGDVICAYVQDYGTFESSVQ